MWYIFNYLNIFINIGVDLHYVFFHIFFSHTVHKYALS